MNQTNCGCMNPEQAHALRNVGIAGFVVTELALYLDTHPMDRDALNYYNYYNRMYRKMSEEYSAKYDPLTLNDAVCGKEWKWGQTPLPWERMGN